jgi:hypothetical protein
MLGLAISGIAAPFASAQTKAPAERSAQASTAAETAVLKADSDRFVAMLKADVAALEKLLAADLSYAHSSGAVQTKDEFVNDLKTGTLKYVSIEPRDQKVRVYGTVAVVTGGAAVHIIQRGTDQSFQLRYTNVQVLRNGAWQMVAWQATRLPS